MAAALPMVEASQLVSYSSRSRLARSALTCTCFDDGKSAAELPPSPLLCSADAAAAAVVFFAKGAPEKRAKEDDHTADDLGRALHEKAVRQEAISQTIGRPRTALHCPKKDISPGYIAILRWYSLVVSLRQPTGHLFSC